MNIDIKELMVFDNVVQEISKQYNLPSYVAAHRLFNEIRDYRKIGGMKTEISRLCQQAFVVNEVCTNQNKAMRTILNLQSRRITEEQIISLSNTPKKSVHPIVEGLIGGDYVKYRSVTQHICICKLESNSTFCLI